MLICPQSMCHVITTPRVYLFFNVGWKQRSRKIHLVLILFVLCRPQIHACFRFYQFLISFSMVGTTLFQHCELRFSFAEKCGCVCALCKFQLIFFICAFNPIEWELLLRNSTFLLLSYFPLHTVSHHDCSFVIIFLILRLHKK